MKKFRSLLRLAHGVVGKPCRRALLERVSVLKDGMAGSRDDVVIFKTVRRVLGAGVVERLGLKCPHAGRTTRAPQALVAAAAELCVLTEALEFDGLKASGLRKSWKRTLRKCRDARRAAKRSGAPHDFHTWRKRVKDVWYQGEALAGRWADCAAAVRPAKKLADVLGFEHDLTLALESVPALSDGENSRLRKKREKLRSAALAA